jgi:hypothetical protein
MQIPEVVISHRDLFPLVLNENGFLGEGVEVGVKFGEFSETILKAWVGKKLYSIDPWKEFSQTEYQDIANVSQNEQEEIYQKAVARLAPFGKRSEIIRKTSLEASTQFEDGALDFTYLDAQHHYDAVKEDLAAWYPKLKIGGILAGHDYVPDGKYQAGDFGVKQAVDEFAAKFNLQVLISGETEPPPYMATPSWFIIKSM